MSTPFCEAIWSRSIARLKKLLVTDPDCLRQEVECPPAFTAVLDGSPGMVQVLVDHGVPVNVRIPSGCTPLHHAAVAGRRKMCEVLLAAGADANARNDKGATVLAYSRCSAHKTAKACARLLLTHGAQEDILSAIYDHNNPLVEELVAKTRPNTVEFNVLHQCIPDMITAWSTEADMLGNYDEYEKWLRHVIGKNSGTLEMLIKHGADIDGKGVIASGPAIFVATSRNQNKTLLLDQLLRRGASPNVRMGGRHILDWLTDDTDHPGCYEMLIANGATRAKHG